MKPKSPNTPMIDATARLRQKENRAGGRKRVCFTPQAAAFKVFLYFGPTSLLLLLLLLLCAATFAFFAAASALSLARSALFSTLATARGEYEAAEKGAVVVVPDPPPPLFQLRPPPLLALVPLPSAL